MNVARLVLEAAQAWPESTALRIGKSSALTYRELVERTARLAGYLRAQGVLPNRRVAMFMTNHPAYLELLHAIFWAGAIAVPVNAKLHERELAFILDESGAQLLFVNDDTDGVASRAASLADADVLVVNVDRHGYASALREEPASLTHRDGDDVAWLFFTSGTTGRSKGAMLTHRNLHLMTASYLTEVDAVGRDEALLHAAPMSHGSGVYNFIHVARGGAHIVPESHGFDVAEIIDILGSVSKVSFFAAPTMVQRFVAGLPADDPLSGLKLIVYGGGPMLVEPALAAIGRLGPRLAQIYGQGECPMTITRLPPHMHQPMENTPSYRRRLASVGTPFHLVDVRIGSAAEPLPAGEAGEVLVSSPLVMKGYWNRAADAESFDDGWLRTGDIGYFDEEGYLHLSDRSKDVIISGGSNIYSREIEDVLAQHSGVREVAVVGRPHAEWGEEVVAVISSGATEPPPIAELDALCQSQIARFKRPRHYTFMAELPKNAYGKIDKRRLKESIARNTHESL